MTRAALQQEVTIELAERDSLIDEAAVLFSEFAKQLYGPEREAYLRFEPGQSSLKIVPHIASDNSRGIGSMVMFCFAVVLGLQRADVSLTRHAVSSSMDSAHRIPAHRMPARRTASPLTAPR